MLSHIDRAFEIKEFSPFGPSQLVCMHDDVCSVGQFDSKAREKVTAALVQMVPLCLAPSSLGYYFEESSSCVLCVVPKKPPLWSSHISYYPHHSLLIYWFSKVFQTLFSPQ